MPFICQLRKRLSFLHLDQRPCSPARWGKVQWSFSISRILRLLGWFSSVKAWETIMISEISKLKVNCNSLLVLDSALAHLFLILSFYWRASCPHGRSDISIFITHTELEHLHSCICHTLPLFMITEWMHINNKHSFFLNYIVTSLNLLKFLKF